ncbi:MAG: Glu/Leu/Phe/Val dehydrogenase dimerization domain-containing protein [Pseudomonadota bacterium]
MTLRPTDFTLATAFEDEAYDDHEQVVFCRDKINGLKAIIALHSTKLGPALGGTRMWDYGSSHEALTDVLRLSRGMTYKNALAGIPFGGGKAVIMGDSARDKTPDLFAAFGRFVDGLAGRYVTAEDVGISADDIEQVALETPHARGTRATGLGDPSPYTALGVFSGIRAVVEARFGKTDLTGMRFAVQGLGSVGFDAARRIHEAGGRLIVADINNDAVGRAIAAFGAETAPVDRIHAVACDVFVPCALGAGLNEISIPEIQAGAVAGAANNQLAEEEDGLRLRKRQILYAPDYVINAGGVISIALGKPDAGDADVVSRIKAIRETLLAIFGEAREKDRPTADIADAMAERIVAAA